MVSVRLAFAAAVVGLVVLAAPALAAQPLNGSYSYTVVDSATGFPTMTTTFSVTGRKGHKRVKKFSFYAGVTCWQALPTDLSMPVGKKGKFSGSGFATETSGEQHRVKVAGKFTTSKKASGTISSTCGRGKLYHFKFVVKKGGNRVTK